MNIDYVSFNSNIEGAEIKVEKFSEENGIIIYHFVLKTKTTVQPSPVTLNFFAPALGFFSQWSPLRDFERSLLPNWGRYLPETPSRLAFGAPLQSFIGQDGQNKVCIAVSDVKTPIIIRSGLGESPIGADYQIEFFSSKTAPISEYSAYIRFDIRNIFYSEAILNAVSWWDEINSLPPAYVPEKAVMPVYSSWYNFHQNINDEILISECEKAYKLGMRSIIIDDGWQTKNSAGGYAYCGEWRLCKGKIKDMRKFTQRLHQIGMKVILWYSVPFVGKKTELWKKFKGKYLDNPDNEWNCLDPRFREVREYLINTYETALEKWDLDGFKLDFIDEFRLTEFSSDGSNGCDFQSLEDALEKLLSDISRRLKSIKPDVLIEFRQSYVGPIVKSYGNMLRVGDCANDMLRNRMGVIDLRLTSGKTAVHSDMIIWNYDDTNENVAKQLIAVLFGVPQISVVLEKISEEHQRVLKFYLEFWIKHRDILINGKFVPYNPECLYSLVEATKNDTSINVCYSKNVVKLHSHKTIIVNGTGENYVIIASRQDTNISYTRTNCLGETVEIKKCRVCDKFCIELAQSDVLTIVKEN